MDLTRGIAAISMEKCVIHLSSIHKRLHSEDYRLSTVKNSSRVEANFERMHHL